MAYRDVDLEFDAPQYRDFDAISNASQGSIWFEGLNSAAAEAVDNDVTQRAALADKSNTIEASKPARKNNIVTSWEHKPPSARAAPAGGSHTGATSKRSGKDAAKGSTSAPQPKTRAQHAAAAADTRKKASIKLQVVKPQLKKGASKVASKKAEKLHKILLPVTVKPVRSKKGLTIPEDLELHTSKRAQAHTKKGDAAKQVDDHGAGDDADEFPDEEGPYVPLPERVKVAFDKTPSRFKRQPDKPLPSKPLSITEAKEPDLTTSHRIRPSVFKPREQEEAEMMASMPMFKASTLNPLILSTSEPLGLPKVDKRGATAPQPFHFISDDRAEARARRLQHDPITQQPTTSGKIDKEENVAKKARKSVAYFPTEPRSPQLHTKFRAREAKIEEERYEFHARPVPNFISMHSTELMRSGSIGVAAPAPTQPQPFNLKTEARGARAAERMAAKAKAEEVAAQNARIPRAHGIPLSTDQPLVPPKPESRSLTVPEPFGLASEMRHEKYMEHKRKMVEEEEAVKRQEAEFKARPMWRGIPYRLHDVHLPLTVPEEVQLTTAARAAEREVFDRAMEEKMKEAQLQAELAAQEARAREEEERKRLRKAANFHARPMPDLSVPETFAVPPPKPLTQPVSPALRTSRSRRKTQAL